MTDTRPGRTLFPPELQGNTTHINLEFWKEQLEHHPDREFTSLIINGLHLGFTIGFDPDSPLKSATCNLISTTDHEEVVSKYIREELTLDHIGEVGSVQTAHRFAIQISPIGVIPKKGRPAVWRLIMDLSSPEGYSVNDGIDKEDCSFHYVSVDTATAQIRARYTFGQNGHKAGLQEHPGSTTGQTSTWVPVARKDIH